MIVMFNIINGTKMVSWQQGLTISHKKTPRENIESSSNKFKTNSDALCVNFSRDLPEGMGTGYSMLCDILVSQSLNECLKG